MNVSNVGFNSIAAKPQIQDRKKQSKAISPSFQHHPDFEAIKSLYHYPLCSLYFRRGNYTYDCRDEAIKKFPDVINALTLFFSKHSKDKINFNLQNNKAKMLIGGVGHSEEPFSYLAVIKSIIDKTKLDDILDLHIVDLISQPNKDKLFEYSYFDKYEPEYVKTSFIEDNGANHGLSPWKYYRVADEIFEYLSNTYDNESNSKWETRIQDSIKEYPENSFDIISLNNVLMYMGDDANETVKNIYRILKPSGLFFTDINNKDVLRTFTPQNSVEIYDGIYQKRVGSW